MEISQEDRLKILEEISPDVGLSEREADEFTSKELTVYYNIALSALPQHLESHKIKHTRRKAIVDGHKKFVYKLIKEVANTQ